MEEQAQHPSLRGEKQRCMLTLCVQGSAGVRIDPKRMDEDYGRFAWVYHPEGYKSEL